MTPHEPPNLRPAFDSCMSCLYIREWDHYPEPSSYTCEKFDIIPLNVFLVCDDYEKNEVDDGKTVQLL